MGFQFIMLSVLCLSISVLSCRFHHAKWYLVLSIQMFYWFQFIMLIVLLDVSWVSLSPIAYCHFQFCLSVISVYFDCSSHVKRKYRRLASLCFVYLCLTFVFYYNYMQMRCNVCGWPDGPCQQKRRQSSFFYVYLDERFLKSMVLWLSYHFLYIVFSFWLFYGS